LKNETPTDPAVRMAGRKNAGGKEIDEDKEDRR
jgi:hypothetical protein